MSFWSALGQVASRNHSLHDFSLRGRVQGAREGTANNQQAGRPARRRRRRSRPRAAPPEGCEVEEETAENQWRRRLGRRLGVRFGTLPACGMRGATGFRGPDQLVCRRRFLSRLDDLLTTASVRRPVWWAWHAQMRTELKYSS